MKQRYSEIIAICAIAMMLCIASIPGLAMADDAKWKADTIADAELLKSCSKTQRYSVIV